MKAALLIAAVVAAALGLGIAIGNSASTSPIELEAIELDGNDAIETVRGLGYVVR